MGRRGGVDAPPWHSRNAIVWYSGVRSLIFPLALFAFTGTVAINRINFAPRQLRLLLISLVSIAALAGCGGSDGVPGVPSGVPVTTDGENGAAPPAGMVDTGGGSGNQPGNDTGTMDDGGGVAQPGNDTGNVGGGDTQTVPTETPTMDCASYTNADGDTLTAMAVPTAAAPNCVYEASFVDNGTPLTESITLADLPDRGVHVFEGSLVVGEDSATLAGVPTTPVVLTIEAGTTVAFRDEPDRLIVNRGAQIEAVGTADNPITFTSLEGLIGPPEGSQRGPRRWAGITINGTALNNACTYAGTATGEPSRPLPMDAPFLLDTAAQPTLTALPTADTTPVETCSQGDAVFTAGATASDAPTLGDGFHGGTNPADDSGELRFVIIIGVGAETIEVNRNALQLRSVGTETDIFSIEVASVDGSGILVDGGGAALRNVLVNNPRMHGVHLSGGYLGLLNTVLVSQRGGDFCFDVFNELGEVVDNRCITSETSGLSCVQVDSGAGGESAAQIDDGMNTRVTLINLTCDITANANDNDGFVAGGAGVIVTEGARARLQNAIIVGSRVEANVGDDNDNERDNVCLDLKGDRSIIEADGVIVSCLEESEVVTATNFKATTGDGARVIATDADVATPTTDEVALDIQFHMPGAATTVSPLIHTDTSLVVLRDAGTIFDRPLFSLPLMASMVDGVAAKVIASGAESNDSNRPYLGAIAEGAGNNPFSGWTVDVFE